MSAATCQLTGIDPVNPNQQCLGVDNKTGKIGFVPSADGGGGAIGMMGKMISVLYTPPLHTGDYFNHLAQNFGIVKPVHAQGTGFEGLNPLLGLWTAFRNIVYLIFTIVFVVIGLAIMFRIKIDPRTVMTIQNQIPKIIVGIVLVTFSYAIAGFLIDMMYGSIYLIGNVITSTNKKVASGVNITGVIQSDNPFSAASQTVGFENVAWEPAKTAGGFISPIFDNPLGRILVGIVGSFIGSKVRETASSICSGATNIISVAGLALTPITGGISNIVAGIANLAAKAGNVCAAFGGKGSIAPASDIATHGISVGNAKAVGDIIGIGVGGILGYVGAPFLAKGIFSLIAFLIIAIAILWSLFRLWFALIMAYIYILIDVVFAPFWIAGGIIPGQPVTFGGWLRHILSYIAAFPTTIALFLLGKVFIDAFGTDQKGFVPPLIGNPTDTNALGAIIGLGIILLSSNVVNMTTKAFKAPKIDFGRIGQAIGVGAATPARLIGGAVQTVAGEKYELTPTGTQERGLLRRALRGFGVVR